jgi:hypothetical protein
MSPAIHPESPHVRGSLAAPILADSSSGPSVASPRSVPATGQGTLRPEREPVDVAEKRAQSLSPILVDLLPEALGDDLNGLRRKLARGTIAQRHVAVRHDVERSGPGASGDETGSQRRHVPIRTRHETRPWARGSIGT